MVVLQRSIKDSRTSFFAGHKRAQEITMTALRTAHVAVKNSLALAPARILFVRI
jgi:hypothetical protein